MLINWYHLCTWLHNFPRQWNLVHKRLVTGRSFTNLRQVDRDIYFFIISASTTPVGWQLQTDMYILHRLSTHPSINFQLNIWKICTPHPMAVYLYFLWQAKTWIPSSAQSANVVPDNLLNSKNSRIDTRTATIRTELPSFLQVLVDLCNCGWSPSLM